MDTSLKTNVEIPQWNGFSSSTGTGDGFNWGQVAQFAPMIGQSLGGIFGGTNAQSTEQGASFIPMQNSQIQTAKMINPIMDKGLAHYEKMSNPQPTNGQDLYNYLTR